MINRGLITFAFTLLIVSGCAGLKDLPKYQLKTDYYLFKQTAVKPMDVFVDVQEDTLRIIGANNSVIDVKTGEDQTLIGFNRLTVDVGAGWDYLTDRHKDIWIYQNKPWYGLTLGLNLN